MLKGVKSIKTKALLSSLIILTMLLFMQPAHSNTNYEWTTLHNTKDRNGNSIGDTQAYGYFLGDVFVVCDVETKLPTGKAFYNNGQTKTVTEEIIIDWEMTEKENWDAVKRIDPVEVTIKAPNIVSDLTYDWDHYLKTGELREKAEGGSVQWPGSTGAYLVPGSDPNYWLIVAEVTNPNPWPVKTSLDISISEWRSGFYNWSNKGALTKEIDDIYIGANETKFVLINRDNKDVILGEDIDWVSPVYMKAWSDAFYSVSVSENLDPEHPENLKPNYGYIAFDNYGGPPVPRDLTDGIKVSYQVDCHSADRYNDWHFNGNVSLTENGWVTSAQGHINPEAKRIIEDFFTRHQHNLPHIDNKSTTIEDIKFFRCKRTGNSAYISSGPRINYYDNPGPVLVDYNKPDDYNLKARTISVKNNYQVGWCNKIPVLKYRPIFIEQYEFEPTDPENNQVGRLVKKTLPGYNVFADFIDRPYFKILSQIKDYEIIEDGDVYSVKLNYHIDISAVNTNRNSSVKLSNVNLVAPNDIIANRTIKKMLGEIYQVSVPVSPDYNNRNNSPSQLELPDLTIKPNTEKIVLSREITTEYRIGKYIIFDKNENPYLYERYTYHREYHIPYSDKLRLPIDKKAVENIIKYTADNHYNWSGEAAFGKEFKFQLIDDGDKILSLNNAKLKIKKTSSGYRYTDVGLIDENRGCKLLQPLSYFNPQGNSSGLNMKATDELWTKLKANKELTSYRENHSYWPILRYINGWSFSLLYT